MWAIEELCKEASLEVMEQHGKPRKHERLVVTVDGRDKSGHLFTQNA